MDEELTDVIDDEMFSYDIENNCILQKDSINNKDEALESLIQPKSILYKVKDTDDDTTMVIIKTIVTLFIICFILPFIFIDLYIAYTDKSCVNDYPPKLKISLNIYLQLNSYILLLVLSVYIAMIHKKIQVFACDEIMKTIFYLFMYVSRIIIFGWNVLGAILFWGYIAENSNCSVVVYNYLYVTFIIRLLIITLLISNTKNSIKDN
jgi:hypothetical protein